METIREALIKGLLRKGPVEFDEAVVSSLEARVIGARPNRPTHYAYVVGCNWAVSRRRKIISHARREARNLLAAERARLERESMARCRAEFYELAARLLPTLPPVRQKWLGVVRISAIEGLNDAECAERFPKTSVSQRYQWKCRGIRFILPHASEELRKLLTRQTKTA